MPGSDHTIFIAADGTVRFVYDDALAPLLETGEATIQRASDVEPCGQTPDGKPVWYADLSRAGGKLMGPFRLRSAAIAAEIDWLNQNLAEVSL